MHGLTAPLFERNGRGGGPGFEKHFVYAACDHEGTTTMVQYNKHIQFRDDRHADAADTSLSAYQRNEARGLSEYHNGRATIAIAKIKRNAAASSSSSSATTSTSSSSSSSSSTINTTLSSSSSSSSSSFSSSSSSSNARKRKRGGN